MRRRQPKGGTRFFLGPGPQSGTTRQVRSQAGNGGDPMKLDFVPDDYGQHGTLEMENADSYNYLAGNFDGSQMGPPDAKICQHPTLGGDPDRTVLHRNSTVDYLQWNHTAAAGNCFYNWKGDGDHTEYWDDVEDTTAAWSLTIEFYRIKATSGHGIQVGFWGNADLSYGYQVIFLPSANQMRILKRNAGGDEYWNSSTNTWGSIVSAGTSLPPSWTTLTINYRPGVSFDVLHGSTGDNNITDELYSEFTGKPVCMIGCYLAGSVGEQLWTREIHRDYT